jgi:ABC-type multidrug transport system ATPase subunit
LESKRDALIHGLSRGMKQRLGIARAMIHRPKVLLLDEPASGLDPKARIELRNLLRATRDAGATILISSHILTELEGLCTSIGIMEKGRLVRSGKLEEVISAGVQSRLIRLQWLGDSPNRVQELLTTIPTVSDLVSEIKINLSVPSVPQVRARTLGDNLGGQIAGGGQEGMAEREPVIDGSATAEADFRFSGSEEDQSQLLAQLIAQGFRVVSFRVVRETVEEMYMKLSTHEVT